jgi:hypothetical protein
MEQLKGKRIYSKPEFREPFATKEIIFNVGHGDSESLDFASESSHWLFGFPLKLFDEPFGQLHNTKNQILVILTIIFSIYYFSK